MTDWADEKARDLLRTPIGDDPTRRANGLAAALREVDAAAERRGMELAARMCWERASMWDEAKRRASEIETVNNEDEIGTSPASTEHDAQKRNAAPTPSASPWRRGMLNDKDLAAVCRLFANGRLSSGRLRRDGDWWVSEVIGGTQRVIAARLVNDLVRLGWAEVLPSRGARPRDEASVWLTNDGRRAVAGHRRRLEDANRAALQEHGDGTET